MKTLVLILMVLAVLVAGSVSYFSKNAPKFLQQSVEKSLNKKVEIESIEYQFPSSFKLNGFRVIESDEAFNNSAIFSADEVEISTSIFILFSDTLNFHHVSVKNARAVIRKSKNKYTHFLSGLEQSSQTSAAPTIDGSKKMDGWLNLPSRIHIGTLQIKDSQLDFSDYDIQASGFVVRLEKLNLELNNLSYPAKNEKTSFDSIALISQGRGKSPAPIEFRGQVQLATWNGEAFLQTTGLSLPYFSIYLDPITDIRIQEGILHLRNNIELKERNVINNIHVDISSLFFESSNSEQQVFGFKVDDLVRQFKDKDGSLDFQTTWTWNLDNPQIDVKTAIQKSIEASLKRKILSSAESILEKTLKKFAQPDDPS